MRLTIRLLGVEVLHITVDDPDPAPDPLPDRGDCTTYPVGFTGPPAWEADPYRTDRLEDS